MNLLPAGTRTLRLTVGAATLAIVVAIVIEVLYAFGVPIHPQFLTLVEKAMEVIFVFIAGEKVRDTASAIRNPLPPSAPIGTPPEWTRPPVPPGGLPPIPTPGGGPPPSSMPPARRRGPPPPPQPRHPTSGPAAESYTGEED